METTTNATKVTVETTVNAPVEKVWEYWKQRMTLEPAVHSVHEWKPKMEVLALTSEECTIM